MMYVYSGNDRSNLTAVIENGQRMPAGGAPVDIPVGDGAVIMFKRL